MLVPSPIWPQDMPLNETANISRIAALEAELEELRDIIRQKDRFLATVSHEIRSPMNGVFGMADALSLTPLDKKQRRYLDVLKDACDTMLLMANQLLEKGRMEAGQAALVPVDFDIAEFVADKVEEFSGQAQQKGLLIELETKILTNSRIRFDKLRLGQVLNNLISNAIRYSDQGRIIVRLFLQSGRNRQLQLVLSVEDSGIGIAPSQHAKIFEAFTSANPEESAKRGGTGLGLCLVRDLVALLGGKITVESALGLGSTFTVSLAVDPAEKAVATGAGIERVMPKCLKLLLAEDNDSNAFVFEVLLEDTGIDITRVRNGEEAIAAFRNAKFNIVFMDLQMPLLGGVEAATAIRAMESKAKVPIIALTADRVAIQCPNFQAAGFSDTLIKPMRQSELLDVLSMIGKESC